MFFPNNANAQIKKYSANMFSFHLNININVRKSKLYTQRPLTFTSRTCLFKYAFESYYQTINSTLDALHAKEAHTNEAIQYFACIRQISIREQTHTHTCINNHPLTDFIRIYMLNIVPIFSAL